MERVKSRIERNVRIDSLEVHPANARHGDVGAIAGSIEANGFFTVPIAQASSRRVLVGWHRLQAALQVGMERVPEVKFLDVDDAAALRIVLADNRSSDLASYDGAKLAEVLQAIVAEGAGVPNGADVALEGTGFDGDALDALLKDLEADAAHEQAKEDRGGTKEGWRCPKCGYEAKRREFKRLPPI